MHINLVENGLHSLKVSLEFYESFLFHEDEYDISVDYFGKLKFTIIALQGSIELLSKQILSDINELLIFDMEQLRNNQKIKSLLYRQYQSRERKAHLISFLTDSDQKVNTISYSKTIELLSDIFRVEITNKQCEYIRKLGVYRNALSHFSYSNPLEWYEILITINKVYELISKFYLLKIDSNEQSHYVERIENLTGKGYDLIEDYWLLQNEDILNIIMDKIESYCNERTYSLIIKEFDSHFSYYTSFNIGDVERDTNKIFIELSPLNDSIVFRKKDNQIILFCKIEEKNISYVNSSIEIKRIDCYQPKEKEYFLRDATYNLQDKAFFRNMEFNHRVLEQIILDSFAK